MNLSQLASAPQIIRVELDDAETVEMYGEPVVFYTYDRIPAAKFIKMAGIFKDVKKDQDIQLNPETMQEMIAFVSELVLDEQGQRIFEGDVSVEPVLLMKIVTRVTERLGKSPTGNSTQTAKTSKS